jgi:hypothetical protein
MLAADNLSRSRNDFGFDTRRFHRKLTVHPNLPIAIASSGLSHLNGTPTVERAIAGEITGLQLVATQRPNSTDARGRTVRP